MDVFGRGIDGVVGQVGMMAILLIMNQRGKREELSFLKRQKR